MLCIKDAEQLSAVYQWMEISLASPANDLVVVTDWCLRLYFYKTYAENIFDAEKLFFFIFLLNNMFTCNYISRKRILRLVDNKLEIIK